MTIKIIVNFMIFMVLTFNISARVYSPWVNSEMVPDWSGNWESFRKYSAFDGKNDQDDDASEMEFFND